MAKSDQGIEVKTIAEQKDLEITQIFNDKYIANKVFHPRTQKPGLALTGYFKYLNSNRIQIFGKTEMGYLKQLPDSIYQKTLKEFMATRVPAIIISENMQIDPAFMSMAQKYKIPILISKLRTALLVSRISSFLYRYFSQKTKINGVLMDLMGQGIMITGKSGIGKSETALELIYKGHHLISDDLIEFYLNSNDEPVGRAIDVIKKWLEVRGLGIINVIEIFGVGAMLEEKKLDLVINLEKWNPKKKYNRLGEEKSYFNILGKEIPMITIPVAMGRNIAILIEVAVKYFISQKNGSEPFIDYLYEKRKP